MITLCFKEFYPHLAFLAREHLSSASDGVVSALRADHPCTLMRSQSVPYGMSSSFAQLH